MKSVIKEKLRLLGESFLKVLTEKAEDSKNDSRVLWDCKTIYSFDWYQGVGLYGFYRLYSLTKDKKYLDIMTSYYDEQISLGLPPKTVNSMAPMLALCFLNQELKRGEYDAILREWAEFLYRDLPRTANGLFQHTTSESDNENQLWDDTLFMSVLFLAKAGVVYQKREYVEEAIYQFLGHAKYLIDTATGLWFHGFDFNGNHNFARALWGRGNSWITIFIPEFLEILEDYPIAESLERYILEILNDQIKALVRYQDKSGLWRTLIDDETSYLEASCAAGFGFGILKAVRKGYTDDKREESGLKALKAVIENIGADGILKLVSGGTRMGLTKDFYKSIPIKPEPYGQAMAMLILIEGLLH
ncbi:MAG TPA: glycoside hydrolase family 88 protein [Bacilli bacterium]|jgi:unsaturated rhamnogalacturonyl hydrolase|nr:glycoside hydrolase family 88 protein [Bacilli bacterium]